MKKVEVIRPDDMSNEVLLRFNKAAVKEIQSRKFNTEVTANGILITFPLIDDPKAMKITDKSRECTMDIEEDFVDEWYNMYKISEDEYLIDVVFEF